MVDDIMNNLITSYHMVIVENIGHEKCNNSKFKQGIEFLRKKVIVCFVNVETDANLNAFGGISYD